LNGGHVALLDAELFVENASHGSQTVCGARDIGDDSMSCRVESCIVHSDAEGHIGVAAGSGDHDVMDTVT
jgi:hypothetical protein